MRRKQSEYSGPGAVVERVVARKRVNKRRICLLLTVLLLAACCGLLRQFLHFLNDAGQFVQKPIVEQQRTATLPTLRGTIYDRNLHELAVSYQLFSLHAHPDELADRQAEAEKLALIIGTGKDMLLQQMQGTETVVELADSLNQKQAAEVTALHLPGIRLQPTEARCYPSHTAAGHLLGFISEGIGLSGIEALGDNLLQPGEFRKAEAPGIDFAGQSTLGPKAADVILSIDLKLQKELEQSISTYRKAKEASSASALVMNIENGKLLAAVRQPSFDPNYFWKTKESGILFPQTFSANLLQPLLAQAVAIHQSGMNGAVPPDLVSPLNHGLGKEDLETSWHTFGFDQADSTFLPLVPPLKKKTNQQHDTTKLSVLQIALGTSTFFNSGKWLKPWLLKAVYDPDHDRLFTHDSKADAAERIVPPAAGVLLRQDLLHHSRWGNDKGFLFVNKTTFAQKTRNGMSKQHIQELLLLTVPRENPSMLLVLAVDYGRLQPSLLKETGESKEQTSDQLEDLGESLLPLLTGYATEKERPTEKPPKEKNETNMRRFFLSRQLSLAPIEEEKTTDSSGKIMPDVIGLSLRKGLQRLNPCKLKVQIQGSGKILVQHPAAGTSLAKIKSCTLTLALGPIKHLKPTPKIKVH